MYTYICEEKEGSGMMNPVRKSETVAATWKERDFTKMVIERVWNSVYPS